MSRQINQPITQVRLTNVAVVRMNRGGKRFECACYRNKVVNYRQGLETDLSEVLQTDRIFTNVSKGQFAKTTDLERVFGTRDQEAIAKIILEKGTLQVSDLERNQQYENTLREVATWVANNCVHPTSQRPYTVTQIRQAMKEAEFAIHPTRSVKHQSLDCFKLLQSKQILPIERAKMKLVLVYPVEEESNVREAFKELQLTAVEDTTAAANEHEEQVVVLVDPSLYRALDEIAKHVNGRLEILQQVVRQEGDVDLELEMKRKEKSTTDQETEGAELISHTEGMLRISSDAESDDVAVDEVPHTRKSSSDNAADEEYRHSHSTTVNMRQNQKRANKKSKKAKRREKEEAAERQARIDAEKQRQEERSNVARTAQTNDMNPAAAQSSGQAKSCNTCGGSFPSDSAYRSHFRSDWHRYNIKLKMKGVAPVSEQEFLLCDSDAFFEER